MSEVKKPASQPTEAIDGLSLSSIDDLLTPEQWETLHRDLAEMARRRRAAESASAWIPLA